MAAEQVPGAAGQVDPVLPGPDEPGSPFAPHYVGDALGGGQRQHPQRVAVQVDQRRVVTGEALAKAGQRIGRVAAFGEGAVAGEGRHASTIIRRRAAAHGRDAAAVRAWCWMLTLTRWVLIPEWGPRRQGRRNREWPSPTQVRRGQVVRGTRQRLPGRRRPRLAPRATPLPLKLASCRPCPSNSRITR